MGIQTMLSSAPNGSSASDLGRQASVFSLILEEVQTAINEPGRAFGSMNMEEFMKNLWTADESQAMVSASTTENNNLARQPSLQRLCSHSLPPALSRKTVEDVWRDIQGQLPADRVDEQGQRPSQQKRQLTLGEMTLEDFLSRAGAFRDDPNASSVAGVSDNLQTPIALLPSPGPQTDWMSFGSRHQHQQMLQQAEAAAAAAKRGLPSQDFIPPTANLSLYDGLPDSSGLGQESLQNTLALSPSVSEYAMHGRKRSNSEALIERTMERRQKRMIKNRESAARSRARKQAYTIELEEEVTKLQMENAMLKHQQALENGLPETAPVQQLKVRVLRRVRSW